MCCQASLRGLFAASLNASGDGVLGCASVWRFFCFFVFFFPRPGQFSSTFVLVWFVEHVVYGEGLYFLDFDELQIKEDQMNGHVTGGYTLCRAVVQRFGESQHARSHTPITICRCMDSAHRLAGLTGALY